MPNADLISNERIEKCIRFIRGQKVILDKGLATVYEVPTKVFNQAVKRNLQRFPADFMFQLSADELENWRSQIVTSNPNARMSLRHRPYAFTEQGVAMLSSVLKSETAIGVNIAIMRALSGCERFCRRTKTWRGSWTTWKRSTITSSPLSSTRSAN